MTNLKDGRAVDSRPTLAAPDDDPRLYLEEVNPAQEAWVSKQNIRTLEEIECSEMAVDQEALVNADDMVDKIPSIVRRSDKVYNILSGTQHPHGLWRRTTLESYRTDMTAWETVQDFDELAKAEGENWVFRGSVVLPKTYDRAIVCLSRGGPDAQVLREFDLINCRFVEDGFVAPESKCSVVWYDRDTLLLCSPAGKDNATSAGYARTVRLWRRGTHPLLAPVIFETTTDHLNVHVVVDDEAPEERRLLFIDSTNSLSYTIGIGDLSGPKIQLDVLTDISFWWQRGWIAIRTRTAWTIGETTHMPGTLLGTKLDTFLAGSREFEVLFIPAPRRVTKKLFWANGKLVVSIMHNFVPSCEIFTPSDSGWTSTPLDLMSGSCGVGVCIKVTRLDEDPTESDGALLVTVQDPLNPPRLLLTSVDSAPPVTLKCAPKAFDAKGLVVKFHEAISTDGERIPYVEIGPPDKTGDAPVHMTGYGGFNKTVKLYEYRSAIGKIWLERGGTSVNTAIRGGGEFGAEWHDAGRREGRRLSCDDFAAVANDLVRRGVTRHKRIAAEGTSNGGLLISNMLTTYPAAFGALLSYLPLTDMHRFHKLAAGRSWIPEYGNPENPDDWELIKQFSAYHTATANGPAPPILLVAGKFDDRVHPGHARKFADKLQVLGRDALFYELNSGHSLGNTPLERAFCKALGFTFLRRKIGWCDPSDALKTLAPNSVEE